MLYVSIEEFQRPIFHFRIFLDVPKDLEDEETGWQDEASMQGEQNYKAQIWIIFYQNILFCICKLISSEMRVVYIFACLFGTITAFENDEDHPFNPWN